MLIENIIYAIKSIRRLQKNKVETSQFIEIVSLVLLSEKEFKRLESRFNTAEEELLMLEYFYLERGKESATSKKRIKLIQIRHMLSVKDSKHSVNRQKLLL